MKGATEQTKIHYKGADEDFIIFVDDVAEYENYKKGLSDSSISKPALAHFISAFTIFVTHG